jgi:hypothetical protein
VRGLFLCYAFDIKKIQIDTGPIKDWQIFHQVFASAFGFSGFYGKYTNENLESFCNEDGVLGFFLEYLCQEDPEKVCKRIAIRRKKKCFSISLKLKTLVHN